MGESAKGQGCQGMSLPIFKSGVALTLSQLSIAEERDRRRAMQAAGQA